jgi:hypothetical protein
VTAAAIDNDVLLKATSYGLLRPLIDAIPASLNTIAVLAVAKFVVRSGLRKANTSTAFHAVFEDAISKAESLEPTEAERGFAAQLEYRAMRANVALDAGESQLCSIVVTRGIPRLVTGDKRAIEAIGILLDMEPALAEIAGRVICLEQLVRTLLKTSDARVVANAICSRPGVDKALALCFSCTSPELGPESWAEGLESYIGAIRQSAPSVLVESP